MNTSCTTTRPNPANATFEGVQVLRAVAAIAVVAHHALEESLPLLAPGGVVVGSLLHIAVLIGSSGVDLFFVISGFIMLQTNWDRFGGKNASRYFLVRRYARILPLYWTILLFVILARQGGLYRQLDFSTSALVSSFLLLPFPNLLLGVAWTLVYEMYFYYVFAVSLKASNRNTAVVCTAGFLLAIMVVSQMVQLPGAWGRYLSDPIILEFCFGMGIAYCYRYGWLRGGAFVPTIALAAILMIWSTLHFGTADTAGLKPAVRWAAWGFPAALVVISVLWVLPAKTATRRVFLKLGDASFAIYLSHAIVMTAYARLLKIDSFATAFDPLAMTLVTIVFAVVLGWLVHIGIEKTLTKIFKAGTGAPVPSSQ